MGLLTLSSQRPMSQKGYNYPIPDNPLILPPRQKTIAKTETEEVGIKYPVPEQPTLEQKIEESVQKSDDYLEPEFLLYTSGASDRDEAKEDVENTQTLPPYVRNTAATITTTSLQGIYFSFFHSGSF